MSVVVDSTVMIDVLRGQAAAASVIRDARRIGPLHASDISRLEVLAGMRPQEEASTRGLLSIFTWHPVDERIVEIAGELGRRWLPSHPGIDSADFAIAATAVVQGVPLLTCNVKHFPMFSGLSAPY